MGRKAIGRMAAGACGICICYGLAIQAVQGKPTAAEQAIDASIVEQAAAQTEETPDTLSPREGEEAEYYYDMPRRHGHGGKHHRWYEDGDSDGWEARNQEPSQEPSDTEEDEKKKSEEQTDPSDSGRNRSASGDPPTLNQFLSALRCGGCGHNCSLLNPRCMRGRSKAERARTEYAQTYGSDSK